MKSHRIIFRGAVISLLGFVCGCAPTDQYATTNPHQPGPVAGQNAGAAVGVVAGNVAGAGVGVVQGVGAGAASTFNPNYRMVRHWRTETTSDGRTIQVPYDVMVDENGKPVSMPAPSGNSGPPKASTNAPPLPPISNP